MKTHNQINAENIHELNFKSFLTRSINSKGIFTIKVSVWQEKARNINGFEGNRWLSEIRIKHDGKVFVGEFYDKAPDVVVSYNLGKYFGLNKKAGLRCDVTNITNYINSIK